MTQKVLFRTAEVTLNQDTIVSEFTDGKVNTFWYAGKDDSYMDVVAMYGYGNDWRAYALQHELTHHFIADNLGLRWSWSLYSTANKGFADANKTWPNHIEWEENIVNAFQHYRTSHVRDEWNTLHMVFPDDKLDDLVQVFDAMMYFLERGEKTIKYVAEMNRLHVNEPILPR